MASAAEAITPTRGELLKLARRIELAKRGHQLLKEKRDALVAELFDVLDELQDAIEEAYKRMDEAFKELTAAEITMGALEVKKAALASGRDLEVDLDTRYIMGVTVPIIETGDVRRRVTERGYGLIQTSSKLDDAARKFEAALESIIKLAEVEETAKSLAREVEETKRRVNSLENIIIPQLESAKKYIEFRLEELERETFFRLKRIKRAMV
ncbi:MAG: V-type ATP synthase subunit D [Hadesarchaea archaeon]|nr:V-type ATP synthase subunit D [Hadesarchaea archaeon]